jgi:HPt (histidine-containing phosphotransfer) domain-containing protein
MEPHVHPDQDPEMDALRARFGERLREDLEQLTRAMNGPDRIAMHRIAHRMSGAAGMFGYPHLSAKGSALEDALDQNMPDEEIGGAAAELITELEQILSSLRPPAD